MESGWFHTQGTIIIFLHAMVNIFLHIYRYMNVERVIRSGKEKEKQQKGINIFIQHTDIAHEE